MEVPRPTLADIDLPPRRRLRDGSRSVRSSSSLSSVPARVTSGRVGRGRGRSGSTLSTLSTTTSSFSGSSLSAAPISRAVSINQVDIEPDTDNDIQINDYAMNHGSTLIDMINHNHNQNQNEEEGEVEESLADRRSRFTAEEKGKGRAQPRGGKGGETIIVDDEEDDSIQVTGVKRKVHEIEDEEEVEEEEGEDSRLGAYTCPICFSEPTNAVMTTCGHILCSKCLFSCLLAAIARNPNPHPTNQPRPKPRPKSKKKSKSIRHKKEPQPTEWTAEQLAETWKMNRDDEYESIAKEAGLDSLDMEAGRDQREVPVEMVLKGLWKVDGEVVVEGECPVCRKGLPGGYGPPGRRIGGVMPVIAAIGGG